MTRYPLPATRSFRLAPPGRCTNCGADAGEQYCPHCGQETRDLHRSLAGILGEMLDAFAGWDGKIPTTLWLLVRRPGALTAEFLAGRRARYLRPLRLYLTMSVLLFVSMSVVESPRSRSLNFSFSSTPSAAADPELEAFVNRRGGEEGPGVLPWLRHRFKEGLRALRQLPPERRGPAMQAAFMSKVGKTVFVLLPVFAALLRLFHRRTPMYFAEHFVFALHVHALAMLAMALSHLLGALPSPQLALLAAVPRLWMPAYLFVALRRVYGGTRRRTALTMVGLTLTYGPIFLAATTVTAILALFELAS